MKTELLKITSIIKELRNTNVSVLTIYFISLALLYKYAYYNSFNINIINSISTSDLPLFFIDLFPQLLYFFFFIAAIFYLFIAIGSFIYNISDLLRKYSIKYIFKRFGKSFKKDKKINTEKERSITRILIFNLVMFYIFYFFITSFSFPFVPSPLSGLDLYSFSNLWTRIFILFPFIGCFLSSISKHSGLSILFEKSNVSSSKFKLAMLSLTIFYLTGLFATIHAGFKMMKIPLNPIIEFEYNAEKISSIDENIVYVGSTYSQIFIYFRDSAITKPYEISKTDCLRYYNDIFHNFQLQQKLDLEKNKD